MKRYCLTLDLKDGPGLIAEYEQWHKNIWPAITASIKNAGIESLEIYRYKTRMVMVMEADDNFSFDKKAAMDAGDDTVQQWETLMWKYQQPLPGEKEGVKWVLMDKIFDLE
jgi:L-rhamnose mutarotase